MSDRWREIIDASVFGREITHRGEVARLVNEERAVRIIRAAPVILLRQSYLSHIVYISEHIITQHPPKLLHKFSILRIGDFHRT